MTTYLNLLAGNLLVLRDGRVAFIDFGIVGEITPKTAEAMVDFVRAFPAGDLEGVAAALAQMGFTKGDVDVRAFAKDLQASRSVMANPYHGA